jgi:hypothetical protein
LQGRGVDRFAGARVPTHLPALQSNTGSAGGVHHRFLMMDPLPLLPACDDERNQHADVLNEFWYLCVHGHLLFLRFRTVWLRLLKGSLIYLAIRVFSERVFMLR